MNTFIFTDWDPGRVENLSTRLGGFFNITPVKRQAMDRAMADAHRCEIAIGGRLPREFLAAAPNLRYVIIPYAGLPAADQKLLTEFPGLTVLNSHFNAGVAAEHAWSLLLAAAKRLLPADRCLRSGDWSPRYESEVSTRLRGGRLLLVGYGAIGRQLALYGRAFGMGVSAIRRREIPAPELDEWGCSSDLPRLLPGADIIVISLPGTAATEGLIGAAEFALMKPGVVLVNIGRGSAVDEAAFHTALRDGKVAAAGIDTWWRYPSGEDEVTATHPSSFDLSRFDNLVMSPHRASHVVGREEERLEALAEILESIRAGEPINVVDLEAGY